jgi:hypothetical protein
LDLVFFKDPYILFGQPIRPVDRGIYLSAGGLYLVLELAQAPAGLFGADVNDLLLTLAII